MAITLGTMVLTRTFNSIGIRLPYTGTWSGEAATLEFKRSSDVSWREGLPLYPNVATTAFFGSVLLCDAGTQYDVRVTVSGSPSGTNPQTETNYQTRANLTAAPTFGDADIFVDATGGGDYLTLQLAYAAMNSATADHIIGVADNGSYTYYQRPTASLIGNTHSVSVVFETPAVDLDRVATTDPHAIVYDRYISPAGSGDTGSLGQGIWNTTTLNGYQVYYADIDVSNIKQLCYRQVVGGDYAAAKSGQPSRVSNWSAGVPTAELFAELVHTTQTYNVGHWQTSTRLYLRLPGDIDPDTCYIWMGSNTGNAATPGTSIGGSDQWVVGGQFRVCSNALRFAATSVRGTMQQNLIEDGEYSIYLPVPAGGANSGGVSPTDFTVQYNLLRHTNLWGDYTTEPIIPWIFIKQKPVLDNGELYATNRIGGASETQGVKMLNSGTSGVVRYNTFDGTFNGVGSQATNRDVTKQSNIDVHDNLFKHLADNAIEPEGTNTNWRVWNNREEESRNMYSTDFSCGPLYAWRNQYWAIGVQGIAPHNDDDTNVLNASGQVTQRSRGGGGQFVKYGRSPDGGPKRLYLIHETGWTDESDGNTTKGATAAVGNPADEEWFVYNVLWRCNDYLLDEIPQAKWHEEGSFFATTDTANVLDVGGVKYNSADTVTGNSITLYQAAYSTTTTNEEADGTKHTFRDWAWLDAQFVDAAAGDLTLDDASDLINSRASVPNISDLPTEQYVGSAPDPGALESGIEEPPEEPDPETGPATPTSLDATIVGLDVDLTWVDVATTEDAYVVERSSDGGTTWATIATLPAGSVFYTDVAPPQGVALTYAVRCYRDVT
jgi:hypothetical protein